MIHGFNSSPNSSWMPWLMGELKARDIYACSLYMPNPSEPKCSEWVHEITRVISQNTNDQIYLVGHSLGVAAVLNFMQSDHFREFNNIIQGGVLVSGRAQPSENQVTKNFYDSFDFIMLRKRIKDFVIIHGTEDSYVPVENAIILGDKLGIDPIIIQGGTHFTRGEGYTEFPVVLEELLKIMSKE